MNDGEFGAQAGRQLPRHFISDSDQPNVSERLARRAWLLAQELVAELVDSSRSTDLTCGESDAFNPRQ
jgi:hypothetical protein